MRHGIVKFTDSPCCFYPFLCAVKPAQIAGIRIEQKIQGRHKRFGARTGNSGAVKYTDIGLRAQVVAAVCMAFYGTGMPVDCFHIDTQNELSL